MYDIFLKPQKKRTTLSPYPSESMLLDPPKWTRLFLILPEIQFQTRFDLIYSSNSHGFGFNRFHNSILGYNGPMLILFDHHIDETVYTLGIYVPEEIEDRARFHGNLKTFFF